MKSALIVFASLFSISTAFAGSDIRIVRDSRDKLQSVVLYVGHEGNEFRQLNSLWNAFQFPSSRPRSGMNENYVKSSDGSAFIQIFLHDDQKPELFSGSVRLLRPEIGSKNTLTEDSREQSYTLDVMNRADAAALYASMSKTFTHSGYSEREKDLPVQFRQFESEDGQARVRCEKIGQKTYFHRCSITLRRVPRP